MMLNSISVRVGDDEGGILQKDQEDFDSVFRLLERQGLVSWQ